MIINNSPQNQAVLSNVGQVGEFRIRNSAKAFNILSSGLYANKIRAIIRELSCNAVDSHVAAGKQDTPFDVHLPNTLEPWFSIRDYGTGLNHDQVTNIYTTYFESTKTDSNDYIGALGLGCKSPFSYTDNFTVTAIRDGVRGVYTAFINEQGVPSIALMHEENSTEPAGVEVKFSVNDRYDYDKFIKEASQVYTYFKLRPVVHGCKNFTVVEPNYKDRDIIKGVSTIDSQRSIAIMGNIAYPIEVPQADTTLGELRSMLTCGLVIEFDIGELDFQASREGLSYIPSTINAIKNKLEALNNQLVTHIASEANKLTNYWDRAAYLESRHREQLWRNAAVKYAQDTKFPLCTGQTYNFVTSMVFKVEDLAKKYNINIRAFSKDRSSDKCPILKTESIYDDTTKKHEMNWRIHPSKCVNFVVTDTKRGALERAKYHWRNSKQAEYNESVIVLEKADKNEPMLVNKFLKDIYSPPRVHYASTLLEKDRDNAGGNWGKASILTLERRERGRRSSSMVWANAGTASDYDKTKTHYYVEMNHWTPVGLPNMDIKDYHECLTRSNIFVGTIHGVRKNDIAAVKTQNNWVELTGFVKSKLESLDMTNVMGMVKQAIDFRSLEKYNSKNIDNNSPYRKLCMEFENVEAVDSSGQYYTERLLKAHNIVIANKIDPNAVIENYKKQVEEIYKRYPLLKCLAYFVDKKDVVDYINMVDKTKGI
jgi:hypothetical protein